MAKYTAEITNKDIVNGELIIQIRYTSDDGTIIQDSAKTRDTQYADWAKDLIARKIKSLEELPNFVDNIPLGAVSIVKEEPVVKVKSQKEEFLEDYYNFGKLFMLYRQGIIEENNKKLVDLRQKLIDNLNLEYLDIN